MKRYVQHNKIQYANQGVCSVEGDHGIDSRSNAQGVVRRALQSSCLAPWCIAPGLSERSPQVESEQSDILYKQACRTLATGVSSAMRRNVTETPLYFERGEGPYFYDVDGHRLLDYTLGWGPLIAGNNHPQITSAVSNQLKNAYAFGAQHRGEIALAQRMVDVLPGVDQVIFSNTGTEAVQAALRIARTTTGRDRFVKFEGHYHGWLNNVLVSYRPKGQSNVTAERTCGGQPKSEFADTIVLPWNDLEALEDVFQRYPGEIACVICEPILANSGSCLPQDGYLQGVIDLCQRHGALSIFDEVITGFRIALGGAREYFDVTPDLSVYGKALAGGFSLAAVGGHRELFDVLRDGRTTPAGTYNGSPVNIAAAIATLDILCQPHQFESMHEHGKSIRTCIENTARNRGQDVVTSGVGTVFNVHFGVTTPPRNYRDTLKTNMETYGLFRNSLLEHDVYTLPDGRWYIGAVHTDKELSLVTDAVAESMIAVCG